jgi:hypothetical protein
MNRSKHDLWLYAKAAMGQTKDRSMIALQRSAAML